MSKEMLKDIYTTSREARKFILCFGSFDSVDRACIGESADKPDTACCAWFSCKQTQEQEFPKLHGAAGATTVKKPLSLSDVHKAFLAALKEYFPVVNFQEFPKEGIIHDFRDETGKFKFKLLTTYPAYDVKVQFAMSGEDKNDKAFDVLHNQNDIEEVIGHIIKVVNPSHENK